VKLAMRRWAAQSLVRLPSRRAAKPTAEEVRSAIRQELLNMYANPTFLSQLRLSFVARR